MGETLPCTKEFLQRRLDPDYVEPTSATHYLASHEIGEIYWCENKTDAEGGLACKALLQMSENRRDLPEVQTPSGTCLAEVVEITETDDPKKMCLTALQTIILLSREGFKSVKKRP